MKSYLKGVWRYFVSHMLFFYAGAFIFMQMDVWYWNPKKGIEPAFFTATASMISLGIVLYGLAKINEWLEKKKSEKAFEQTSSFIEKIYQLSRMNKNLYNIISKAEFDILLNSKDALKPYYQEAMEIRQKTTNSLIELEALKDSFHIWSIKFQKSELFESLIEDGEAFISYCNLSLTMILSGEIGNLTKNRWEQNLEDVEDTYNAYKEKHEQLASIPYDSLFIIKK